VYRCDRCDAEFNEPDRNESWDAYDAHGYVAVSYFDIEVCPSCGSEAFDEVDDEGLSTGLGTAAETGGVMSELPYGTQGAVSLPTLETSS
jgi:hypothetical protein